MKYNKTIFYLTTLVLCFLIIGSVYYFFSDKINSKPIEKEFGTCQTPEEAYIKTQEALNLLSTNINFGIKNAQHLKEYESAKNKVFKNK